MRDMEIDDPLLRQLASPKVDNQSASLIQIESSKLVPLIVVLAITAGLAVGLSVMSMFTASKSERETRMMEYYLLELDAKFINAGLKDPAESIAKKLQSEREK